MNKINTINKDGNVVIDSSWDGNYYGAVLIPYRVVEGISYIKESQIVTDGLDDPRVKKKKYFQL